MKILKFQKNDDSHDGTSMPARGFFEQNAASNQNRKGSAHDSAAPGGVKYKNVLHTQPRMCFYPQVNHLKKTP